MIEHFIILEKREEGRWEIDEIKMKWREHALTS
jgi:hypothetical protein